MRADDSQPGETFFVRAQAFKDGRPLPGHFDRYSLNPQRRNVDFESDARTAFISFFTCTKR
jgi:hypothetical protein